MLYAAPAAAGGDVRDHAPPPAHASSSGSRRSTRPCCRFPTRRSASISLPCACACRRARPCRRSSTSAGGERFGVEILDGIGTTEILHIFLSNRPGRARPGSTGLPVPGYEAAIVDDEGRPVPRGEIGNLRVKGDSTMAVLLEPAREDQGRAVRGLDPHRRQVLRGRGRLLLVLRARGRHAQGGRHLGLAGGGGEHAGGTSRGAGGGGGGPRGRATRLVKPKAFVVLKDRPCARPRPRSRDQAAS